jgi:4-amino-4-deoxy-L-arabinose transferase-like glycosyltransferase
VSFRAYCWTLLAMLPALLVLAALVPPFDDELYYWCWSRDLQLSYYDHPPMVAYLIRLSTELFGNTVLAIRLPAVLSGMVVIGVIGWLSQPRALFPLIILCPVLTYAAILVTPDTPLLLFWALYLAWLVAIHSRLATGQVPWWWWLAGGTLLGCGVLGKYTMGLAAIAASASFLFAGPPRRWFAGYLFHAIVAVAVASPILIHNIRHDFAPIRYQWSHSMSSPKPGVAPFAEFVGVQLLLFSGVPIVVMVWGFRHWRELAADPRLRVCACLFLIPFAFFLFKSTRGRLEGNWAFPCFIACWPLSEIWYERVRDCRGWRLATRLGFALPLGLTAALTWHLVAPVPFLPAAKDRPYRQAARLEAARAAADDLRAAGHTGAVYVTTYQWAALLRWHGVDARQIDGASRPSQFTSPPDSPAGLARAVVCAEGVLPEGLMRSFGPPRFMRHYPVVVRGVPCQELWWMEYSARDSAPKADRDTTRLDQKPSAPPP